MEHMKGSYVLKDGTLRSNKMDSIMMQPSCHKHIIQRGAHLHDFLKKIVQGLVGMGDEQCALGRTIVVKYIQDLDSCICLASTRWTHHHGQPWLHP
jgi:hypothetical protein